ncbi:MAG: ATP-binding cassette domain-containing protein [Actinomycetota bacterium]|nr:ATP-binding cassette domain-containing protein [Actinomycetota bacterium]
MTELVSAKNLAVGYMSRTQWSHADFQLSQGEFAAVIGPNGSGKSTLLKALTGQVEIIEGELLIDGLGIGEGRRMIGYVPQRRNLDEDTVITSREFALLPHRARRLINNSKAERLESERLVDEALDSLGIGDLANRSISTLSGGQLQRVYIAQALSQRPELLLLDEPLSNLDIRASAQLAKSVSELVRGRGVGVMLVAHDLNPLLPYLDKVLFVANGRVVCGYPDEVLTSERLTDLFELPVEVVRDSSGRIAIMGDFSEAHHD